MCLCFVLEVLDGTYICTQGNNFSRLVLLDFLLHFSSHMHLYLSFFVHCNSPSEDWLSIIVLTLHSLRLKLGVEAPFLGGVIKVSIYQTVQKIKSFLTSLKEPVSS